MLKSHLCLVALALITLSTGCGDDTNTGNRKPTDVAEAPACNANQCAIDGQCINDGAKSAKDPCQICRVNETPQQWSQSSDANCGDNEPCNSGDPCDDNNACTKNDVCQNDQCGGENIICDDDNPCTESTCDPAKGCQHQSPDTACDDQNECTKDTCSSDGGCAHELIISAACRPNIDVLFPTRGATIKSESNVVTMKGKVTSGAGEITSFTINNNAVTLANDGSWTYEIQASTGGNLLVFEATDKAGSTRTRAQSFLWSTEFMKPDQSIADSGFVTPGLGVFLGQPVMDDGDHSAPANDLATVLEMMVDNIKLGSYINNPVFEGSTHKANVKNMANDSPKVALTSQNGGLKLSVTITGISGKLEAKSKCKKVLGKCVPLGPDVDGSVKIDKVSVTANVGLSVTNNELKANLKNLNVSMSKPDVKIDGVVGFLANPIINLFEGDIKDELVTAFESTLSDELQPMLEKALSSIAINETFDLPSIDDNPVLITLTSDFHQVAFQTAGAAIRMRTRIVSNNTEKDNQLGFPLRMSCGKGPQTLALTKTHPIEVSLADDTLNALLYAAWRGGIMTLEVPLDEDDLSEQGLSDVNIKVTGLTPPVVSDCNENKELTLYIGDIKADATLKFSDLPMSFTVYITVTASAELSAQKGELSFTIKELKSVNKDVTVNEDLLISLEPQIVKLIDDELVPQLVKLIGGGNIAGIPLPDIDLGGSIDGVPSGAKISIQATETLRKNGNTIVGGELK